MKETGIIRRIDDLGRIVLPKEIRDRLNIDNGDSLDIYTDNDSIILKKYQHIDNNILPIKAIFNAIKDKYGGDYLLMNKNKIIYSTLDGLEINESLINSIESYLDIEMNNKLFINLNKSYYLKKVDDDIYVAAIDNLITREKKDLLGIIHSYCINYYKHL